MNSAPIRSKPSVNNGYNGLLDIKNMRTQFITKGGVMHGVDSIYFTVRSDDVGSLVFEQGSGKSVTLL